MPDTPERFYNVSGTQLSIARYYGGIKFNGVYYIYDPETDTLTREDTPKREVAEKRRKKKAAKPTQEQTRLFEG